MFSSTDGQSHVSPAPGAQLPVSSPQNFPGYASPYGAPVSQAGSGTPTDPYGQSAVVPAPGGAIQIPGVPAPGQPQPVPGRDVIYLFKVMHRKTTIWHFCPATDQPILRSAWASWVLTGFKSTRNEYRVLSLKVFEH